MTSTAPRTDSPPRHRVPVVVVGARPAGLPVGNILRAASVDCVVLETETREFVEQYLGTAARY